MFTECCFAQSISISDLPWLSAAQGNKSAVNDLHSLAALFRAPLQFVKLNRVVISYNSKVCKVNAEVFLLQYLGPDSSGTTPLCRLALVSGFAHTVHLCSFQVSGMEPK